MAYKRSGDVKSIRLWEVPPRRALMRDADERITAAEARAARSATRCDDDDDLVSSCPSVLAKEAMPSGGVVMRKGGRAIR